MSDDIDMQDEGLERGDEPPTVKRIDMGGLSPDDWNWWPQHQDDLIARHRTEAAKLKALNWALDRIFK